MNLIVLEDCFNGNHTYVFKNHVMINGHFVDTTDSKVVDDLLKNNKVDEAEWQEALDAVQRSHGNVDIEYEDLTEFYGLTEFAFSYCLYVEIEPELRQIVLKSDEEYGYYSYPYPYLWCLRISNDEDMRQRILDYDELIWAVHYCENISNDDDMRQKIINAKNPEYAFEYCKVMFMKAYFDEDETFKLSDNDDMKQVIAKASVATCDARWAFEYLSYINREDEDMRQAILDARDPEYAFEYCKIFSEPTDGKYRKLRDGDEDMRQIVLDSKEPLPVYKYWSWFGDEEMKKIVDDYKKQRNEADKA